MNYTDNNCDLSDYIIVNPSITCNDVSNDDNDDNDYSLTEPCQLHYALYFDDYIITETHRLYYALYLNEPFTRYLNAMINVYPTTLGYLKKYDPKNVI